MARFMCAYCQRDIDPDLSCNCPGNQEAAAVKDKRAETSAPSPKEELDRDAMYDADERAEYDEAYCGVAPSPAEQIERAKRNIIDSAVGGWILKQKEKGLAEINLEEVSDVRSAIEEALSRASLHTEGKEGWRPIETAPKDGTHIVGYGAVNGEIGGPWPNQIQIINWDKNPEYPGYNWTCTGSGYYATWMKATHWQPLPDAPSVTVER